MRAFLIAGLGFGDEAKGATVDAICRSLPVDLIVRYNGGCQAAHNVVTSEGVHHTFSQFGSGMLANNSVRTYLSPFMLVEPFSMMKEADALGRLTPDVWQRTTVDGDAVIVTPFHRRLNRLRERARGIGCHGSCGRGIGVAREMELKHPDDVLCARHLVDSDTREGFSRLVFSFAMLSEEIRHLEEQLKVKATTVRIRDLQELWDQYKDWPARIVDGFEPAEWMVFEGAQGVLLDEKHGTAPHNTWTNTTFENADTLLDKAGCLQRFRIGCLRSYATRHGAGPLPTEDANLRTLLPEPHNADNGFQGAFRVGSFDWEAAAKAVRIVGGVDAIAPSHLDYLPALGWREEEFLNRLKITIDAPVGILARGPTAKDRFIQLEP